MKRNILLLLVAALLLMLCGCAAGVQPDTRVLISLVATDGFTVENNGQWVEPGEDAVFRLNMANGCSLAFTDYDGSYTTEMKDGVLELTLEEVRYPARVNLELTTEFATITYMPNGGVGGETVKTYDLTNHIRPNTSIGTDIFYREGYTQTSWNTEPDGSGIRVGLGSRVSAGFGLTLYAQWAPWTDAGEFEYTLTQFGNITIDGYLGDAETVVVPAQIDGCEVTAIAAGAFEESSVKHIILPTTMDRLAPSTFRNSALETVTLFDNIQVISDDTFEGCENLTTLYINAIEAPWGFDYRKESAYADKVDLLIEAQGEKKMVFYGGCSVWYNLEGRDADKAFGDVYRIINMGLNGTVNSVVQMQIMGHFLEEGDVFVHTLELSSPTQLLIDQGMSNKDDKLWCGLEYNYDLFTLVDLRTVKGEFDSFCSYLEKKDSATAYWQYYTDENGNTFFDAYGGVPFERHTTREVLSDYVYLDPSYVNQEAMDSLQSYYDRYKDLGVKIYISYACVNMDEVPEEQQGNVELMDSLVKDAITAMDGPVLISDLEDFLYISPDFYDTNYHLRTAVVRENTYIWIRDLRAQMVLDGLWEDAE